MKIKMRRMFLFVMCILILFNSTLALAQEDIEVQTTELQQIEQYFDGNDIGKDLSTLGWTKYGTDKDKVSMEVVDLGDGQNGAAAFVLDGVTTGPYCAYRLNSLNYPQGTEVTVEMRIKFSTQKYRELVLFDPNWKKAIQIVTNNGTDLRNSLGSKPSEAFFNFETDTTPGSPDFSKGWHKIWMTFSPSEEVCKVYVDSEKLVSVATPSSAFTTLFEFRLTTQVPNDTNGKINATYMDYFKIYPGPPRDIPSLDLVTADVKSGNVDYGQKIILSNTDPDAQIYYTLDGTIPTEESNLYTDGIPVVANNTIIKAYAVNSLGKISEVATFGPYNLNTVNGMAFASCNFSQNGLEVTSEFSFLNLNSDSVTPELIISLNKDDELIKTNFAPITFQTGLDTQSISFTLPEGLDIADYDIVAYAWDSVDEGHPYCEPQLMR